MTFASLVNDTIVPLVDGSVIPLLYSLAFLFFMIGIAQHFFSSSDEQRKSGRVFALWGLVAFVILFSVWGLVHLLLGTFLPSAA